MKRTKTFKAAAALCIMNSALCIGLASCSSDELATTGNEPMEIRLSSGLSVQQVARAGSSVQSAAFDKGETIAVFISEDNSTTTSSPTALIYTTAAAENGVNALTTTTAQYWPSSGNGVNIHAYYPSTYVREIGSDILFNVQTDQSTDENYKKSDLMYGVPEKSNPVARTSEAINLQFQHMLSKVTITLKQGDGSPDLNGAKVTLLGAKYQIYFTPSTGTLGKTNDDTSNIPVFTASASTLTGSCIVPPQSLSPQFVSVELASGGVLVGSLSSAPELKSGNEYKYEITVNLTGLTLTGSINKWNTQEEVKGDAKMTNTSD